MSKNDLKNHMQPESLAMSHGYKPELSEGAVKCPIFQTSTFVFKSAEAGKEHFEIALGKRETDENHHPGLIYSRLNNPDLEVLEDRLCLWDKAEACAAFASGMAATSTAILALVSPGEIILHSEPLYGGTDHFLKNIMSRFGIISVPVFPGDSLEEINKRLGATKGKLGAIFLESPANPTNFIYDIALFAALAKKHSTPDKKVPLLMDNTFLGPIFQKPLLHGADIVVYSATKYIGGHSDVIAGAVLGSKEYIQQIKAMRTYLGSMAGPWTGWLLMRSLETLTIRMNRQCETAKDLAVRLLHHPKVEKVYYPGLLKEGSQYEIFKRQCTGPGAMISFDIKGGEKEAFRFLNSLKLIKLAVSLGGTESLAEHPKSMTHASVDDELKTRLGISDQMVRFSVGVEHPDDLWWDLNQALAH